jgi:hypothetical protein
MIYANWKLDRPKRFQGSLPKGDYGNTGYSHNPYLSPYDSLSHKQQRHFRRYILHLCQEVKLGSLPKIEAIKLIRCKHLIGLKDGIDLFNEVYQTIK